MFGDRLVTDFCCSDCNEYFESASNLLSHFALHVSKVMNEKNNAIEDNNQENGKDQNQKLFKKEVPGLYPIYMLKNTRILKNAMNDIPTEHNKNLKDEELLARNGLPPIKEEIRIEIDDEFNPLKYCSISMEEQEDKEIVTNIKKKKYPCPICSKLFGWSTDLKRHILTHTGERPFKCKFCIMSFTRKFLLEKHKIKKHHIVTEKRNVKKINVPSLQPLVSKITLKTNQSDKQSTAKDTYSFMSDNNTSKLYKKNLGVLVRPHLNLVSAGTTVQ